MQLLLQPITGMSTLSVSASALAGTITIPPSKSHTMRALLFACMAQGVSQIFHPLWGSDTEKMIAAILQLGATVEKKTDRLIIKGVAAHPMPPGGVIDAGNSGQVLRFMAALATFCPSAVELTGDHSLQHIRPMEPLLQGLRQLGGEAFSKKGDGHAPVIVKGPLHPGRLSVDGADSQPVSALLITTAFLKGSSEIFVANPQETPWLEVTLSWLKRFHQEVKCDHYRHFFVPGFLQVPAFEYTVAGDWSSAAFALGAALTTQSKICLKGLDRNDVQGDKVIVSWLKEMGAWIIWENDLLVIDGTQGNFKGITANMEQAIDALPLMAVVASFASSPSLLYNAKSARHKESDRLRSIKQQLELMGGKLQETEDALRIFPAPLQGAALDSCSDHRIAMALAVAALGAKGTSTIKGWQWTQKSYPSFMQDFQQLNAQLQSAPLSSAARLV